MIPLRFNKGRANKGVRLYCFSPPIMLATFIIEITAAVYATWRYRLNVLGRLVVASLLSLGLFQLSEYFVCGGAGLTASGWARAGYVAITMLPPLGLHVLYVLGERPGRRLVTACYTMAVGFIAYFLSYSYAFTGYQCTGNYVIFQLAIHSGIAYGAYYYGWLLAALGLGVRWLRRQANLPKPRRQAIKGLLAGYLVFILPTAISNTVKPETRQGIPSIMCGFAVLYALILVAYMLPRVGQLRTVLIAATDKAQG
jgi:hypothetical protein